MGSVRLTALYVSETMIVLCSFTWSVESLALIGYVDGALRETNVTLTMTPQGKSRRAEDAECVSKTSRQLFKKRSSQQRRTRGRRQANAFYAYRGQDASFKVHIGHIRVTRRSANFNFIAHGAATQGREVSL